jgi:hypothetical protein
VAEIILPADVAVDHAGEVSTGGIEPAHLLAE